MVTRASNPLGALVFREGYTEVEEVLGMRLRMEGDTPQTQYLVKWKVRGPKGGRASMLLHGHCAWPACIKGFAACATLQLRALVESKAISELSPSNWVMRECSEVRRVSH